MKTYQSFWKGQVLLGFIQKIGDCKCFPYSTVSESTTRYDGEYVQYNVVGKLGE